MRKNSQYATAGDTFNLEALIRDLDRDGANNQVRQGRFDAANDGMRRRLPSAA